MQIRLVNILVLSAIAAAAALCVSPAWAEDAHGSDAQAATQQPAAGGQLPEGHPPMGGSGAQLPEGHPPMPGVDPNASTSVTGSLVIKAVQGTEGGPAVGGDAVIVDFYERRQAVRKLEVQLDEHGVVMLEDLEFPRPVQPVVTVVHAGVPYRQVGQTMSATQPDLAVRVAVYETTHDAPAWQYGMRHVIVTQAPAGLLVREVVAVENPSDRAWVGEKPDADAEEDEHDEHDEHGEEDPHAGAASTLVLSLPHGAVRPELGPGFDSCCTKIQAGRIVSASPLPPGQTKYQFAYIIPSHEGEATLDLTVDVPVKHAMVFMPDDSTAIEAEGLAGGEAMAMGKSRMRVYRADSLAASSRVALTVQGLPLAQSAQGKPRTTSPLAPKVVAGAGAGVALLAAVALFAVPRVGRDERAARSESRTGG